MIKKGELDAEIRDSNGIVYWSPERAMAYLGVKESTLRKRTAHLTKYHPEANKKVIYFKKEDVEGLRNAPVRMIPFEPEKKIGEWAAPALAY